MTTGTQSDTGTRHVPSSDTGSTAQDKAREAAVAAKDRASDMWSGTKEQARSKLNEQKDVAADRIGSVAESLRESSRRSGDESDPIARFAGTAADSLERLSSGLRNKDVSDMLRDVDSFARNQPVAFFGLALVAGFIAVRAMRDIGDIQR
jgi:hypothetical protein